MLGCPLNNHSQSAWWKFSTNEYVQTNIYLRFEFSAFSMKMMGDMITKEHLDADSEETADFRHEKVRVTSAKRLLVFSL